MAETTAETTAGTTAGTKAGPGPVWQSALTVLSWLAGVAVQLQQAALWSPDAVLVTALAASALLLLAWPRRSGWAGCVALLIAAGALGWACTHARAALRLADALPAHLEGQDLLVTGVIADLPQPGLQGTRFVFETEAASHNGHPVRIPTRLSLGWYRGFDTDALVSGATEDLRAGDRWQLTLRIKQPHGAMNPHGFDLELWLFERGIRATGSVRAVPGAVNRPLARAVAYPVQRARQALRDDIQRQVADGAAAGVLAALVVGDQAAIERADWDLFRTTGVAHLMSISGLHVTLFAWLAGSLLAWLWRCSPRAMLALPAPVAARWGGLVLAAAYALLAGWGVPAQRTVWMIAVVAVLRSLGLRWPLPAVLLAVAFVVTLADPWALLQPGFWLSFVAVGLLIASEAAGPQGSEGPEGPDIPESPERPAAPARSGAAAGPASAWARFRAAAASGLRTQVVATVGLAPLSLLFFQQVSVVGFVANLVAIPLVTLLVTPLGLLGVLLPPLWTLAEGLVDALSAGLKVLAALPMAVWSAAAAPPWAVAAGLLAALLAVLPLPWRLRLCSLPLMLPLLLPAVARPAFGQFELVAADIGQGTAVLLRTRHHLLVYDTGPAYTPDADAGARVLLPLLRSRGEGPIDLLMLSHRDADHVGGAASVLQAWPVRAISSSLVPQHPLLQGAVPHRPCQAGQAGSTWEWDGVIFDVLHPAPAAPLASAKSNALSCVLRVQGQHVRALLTGDIEAAQEATLVQQLGPALKSDVLLVPHHGSRTSSTAAFLDAVAPRVAVVQAAYRSRFGHPAADVEARFLQRGVTLMRSDRCGAWTLPAAGPGLQALQGVCTRSQRLRYWHHPASLQTALPPA